MLVPARASLNTNMLVPSRASPTTNMLVFWALALQFCSGPTLAIPSTIGVSQVFDAAISLSFVVKGDPQKYNFMNLFYLNYPKEVLKSQIKLYTGGREYGDARY